MGYAFLKPKKIHGMFGVSPVVKASPEEQYPLFIAEGDKIEIGIPTHESDKTRYEVFISSESIGSVSGKGAKWTYTNPEGVESASFKSRRIASLELAERYYESYRAGI